MGRFEEFDSQRLSIFSTAVLPLVPVGIQTGPVQSGIELGLFRYLAEAREPLTVNQVTEQTGAERQTIGTLRNLPE